MPPASREDFVGVHEDEDRPDWVVVGDLGRDFTFERLNRALYCIRKGARLIALHKNRVWDNGADGIVLDAGPFVAALEFAAGVEAEVVGKPARVFFELVLRELGLPAGEMLVVGNDIDADGRGAAATGCRTVLVLTGGTTRADLERSGFTPDRVCESVADLAVPD
ncbi:MAG: hypothetical protein AUH92_04605 [Acidobacteria bacterium 13_1_40CM_4_69_4]|nr:MAG: hypothetical protein AUH92_04605 [Acidobacteria bacterium 13_1_40CM_4_69_4]